MKLKQYWISCWKNNPSTIILILYSNFRSEIQGIIPPNIRYEDEFDAGAKYHVAADVPYVKYFTSYVYNFQFYKALCLASGQYEPNNPSKPLHRCNFYGNKNAGNQLVSMLKLGSSKPWKEAMKAITGKGGVISEDIFNLAPSSQKWTKSLSHNF